MENEVKTMQTAVKYESQFFQGVQNLPVITTITERVAEVYSSTKDFNEYLKYSIETAENLVKYGVESAKPLVNKFEKPMAAVDNFAYDQLKKLETNYPIITKPPVEIVESSKNAIQEAKSYGVDKLNTVKHYGYGKVENIKLYSSDKVQTVKNYGSAKVTAALESEIGKEVVSRVEDILTISEKYLDVIIPPVDCGCKEVSNVEDSMNTVQRLSVLTSKVNLRLRCHAIQQLKVLKSRAENKIAELKDVLLLLKEKSISAVKIYQKRVQSLWQELNKEEENQEIQNWQEKLLQKARLLTKSLRDILQQTSTVLSYISTKAKNTFLEASQQVDNLYNTFKLTSGEITDTVITYAQENIHKLQAVITSFGNFFNLNKMVKEAVCETIKTDELPKHGSFETKEKFNDGHYDEIVELQERLLQQENIKDSDHTEYDLQMDQL